MTSSKRRLQFSIKSLLLLVGGLCLWLGITANAARTQREVVKAITKVRGHVEYDWELTADGKSSGRKHPPGPAWLRRWLGDEYFQSVTAVDFSDAWIRDEDLPPIERLGSIRHLWLDETRVTDAVMPQIGRLHNLEFLGLAGTAVTDKGAHELAHLRKLKFLSIAGVKVTDAGMREVAQLKHLETLFAGNWGRPLNESISDTGVACLSELPRLSLLGLEGRGITDRSIETLKKLASLQSVNFGSTAVTDRGVDELKAALPNCDITRGEY